MLVPSLFSPIVSWLSAATKRPSGSARTKLEPYTRIDSAISCPTVLRSGGSGGGVSALPDAGLGARVMRPGTLLRGERGA